MNDELVVRDKSRGDILDFVDRQTPAFFEASSGTLWLHHMLWDAFSITNVFKAFAQGLPVIVRHLSLHMQRTAQLTAEFKLLHDGVAAIDKVMHAPGLIAAAPDSAITQKMAKLPVEVIAMVMRFARIMRTSLSAAWFAHLAVVSLRCAAKPRAAFWIQDANRDSTNADILGYVSKEIGLIIDVEPSASTEEALAAVVARLETVMTIEYRHAFLEIASAHPAFLRYMKSTVGVNLLGSAAPDTLSDESAIINTLLGHNGIETYEEASAAFGRCDHFFNWVAIGDESNPVIAFYGRKEIVDFCHDTLLPALCALADGEGGAEPVRDATR